MPDPKDLNNDGEHQLIVFDDCINDKQQQKNRGIITYTAEK